MNFGQTYPLSNRFEICGVGPERWVVDPGGGINKWWCSALIGQSTVGCDAILTAKKPSNNDGLLVSFGLGGNHRRSDGGERMTSIQARRKMFSHRRFGNVSSDL